MVVFFWSWVSLVKNGGVRDLHYFVDSSPAYLHWKSRSETLELGCNFHVSSLDVCLRAILD